jgi:hexokinase
MGREDSVSNGLITTATLACVAVLAMASVLLGWQKGRGGGGGGGGRVQALIYEFQHRCALPLHLLRKISEAMTLEMTAGLATEGGSRMPMLPTFVEKMPTG